MLVVEERVDGGIPRRVCKNPSCGGLFAPRRRDQVFCNKLCRLSYFSLARQLGLHLVERLGRFPGEEELKEMILDDARVLALVRRIRGSELNIGELQKDLKAEKKVLDGAVADLLGLVEEQESGQGQLGIGTEGKKVVK